MPTTALGTPYVSSSDYVSNYPTVSQNLANAIDAFGGVRVYTNEAARNAAISAPFEGMVAYLTAPTTPAATGGSTAVPTGVKTVYNGSVWVCTTPVGARTDNTGTTNSGTFTATLGGSPGTNPSVTLVTGTTALVMLSCTLSVNTAFAAVSVAVSGAGTVAAADEWGIDTTSSNNVVSSRILVLTGLTAGTNTFTLNYRTGSGATGSYLRRNLTVHGIA